MKVDKHKLLSKYTIEEMLKSGLIEYLGMGGITRKHHRFRCRLCGKGTVFKPKVYRWIVYHAARNHSPYYYVWRRRAILRLLRETTIGISHLDGRHDLKILSDLMKEGKIALVEIKRGTIVLLK